MEVSHEEDHAPNPAPVAVVAFLAPWLAVSALLPDPQRWQAFGLLSLLGLLLVAASAWSHHAAKARGFDARHWAFLTVLTVGVGMLLLLAAAKRDGFGRWCLDCGREGASDEPFCFGCGSAS